MTNRTSSSVDNHWNWGLYFCKVDDRIFVPKQNPWLGWTINLGHPYGPPVLVGIIAGGLLLNVYVNGRGK